MVVVNSTSSPTNGNTPPSSPFLRKILDNKNDQNYQAINTANSAGHVDDDSDIDDQDDDDDQHEHQTTYRGTVVHLIKVRDVRQSMN